jgi:hypothetical protein
MNTFGLTTNYSSQYEWKGLLPMPARKILCGHCNHKVSSVLGIYKTDLKSGKMSRDKIYFCPECKGPTYFDWEEKQFPMSIGSEQIKHIPEKLEALLNEARVSASLGAYTASVLCCRKMLMNISVQEGAKEGKSFVSYVEYLSEKGFIPPNGSGWVDYVRTKGNEANHEIAVMEEDDAKKLLTFVEMLMKFIYEFPSMIPVKE